MNKIQKAALILSIFFCIQYALYILLDFNLINSVFQQHIWVEKLYAFCVGISGFINILLFKKEE